MTPELMPDLRALKADLLAKFECQQSGNCCRREGYVYATTLELQKMAKLLGVSYVEFVDQFVVRQEGWALIASPAHRPGCFVNAQNHCDIYEARPKSCRTYPDWPQIWENHASVLAELAMCPGLKLAFDRVCGTLQT